MSCLSDLASGFSDAFRAADSFFVFRTLNWETDFEKTPTTFYLAHSHAIAGAVRSLLWSELLS